MLNRSASLMIQQAFLKSRLVNLISKDTHLVYLCLTSRFLFSLDFLFSLLKAGKSGTVFFLIQPLMILANLGSSSMVEHITLLSISVISPLNSTYAVSRSSNSSLDPDKRIDYL